MTAHYASRAEERAAVEARRRAYRESRCGQPYRLPSGVEPFRCIRDKGHDDPPNRGKPTPHYAAGFEWRDDPLR